MNMEGGRWRMGRREYGGKRKVEDAERRVKVEDRKVKTERRVEGEKR